MDTAGDATARGPRPSGRKHARTALISPAQERAREEEETTGGRRPRHPRQAGARLSAATFAALAYCSYLYLSQPEAARAQQTVSFPGVSRDLASFCSARPSLSIDLAAMLVHIKRPTSFNYKLYLFSSDNYVFQTGQIVPRDDFRIHSFPVKLKHLSEFLPAGVPTYQQNLTSGQLERVPSSRFNAERFLARVPIGREHPESKRSSRREQPEARANLKVPFDVHGDVLPGDDSFPHHDVALVPDRIAVGSSSQGDQRRDHLINESVHFDRDDQVVALNQEAKKLRQLGRRDSSSDADAPRAKPASSEHSSAVSSKFAHSQRLVMPVGAFSSFHVNLTYLVRKDFDQHEPELVRFEIDSHKFQVAQVHLLSLGSAATTTTTASARDGGAPNGTTNAEDFAFLGHKLLRDPGTRITSINQIYEDWITRNFYTVVYIQRRLEPTAAGATPATRDDFEPEESSFISGDNQEHRPHHQRQHETTLKPQVITDRLIFRGSSSVLLGADQLDYMVKASAFITEKNSLHYYLEFLTEGKFYLGAIDWTRRPFAIIDSQRFPIKTTGTQFDNEELLLCPPSICYSERPIDEVVSYGRVPLEERLQREAMVLTRALLHQPPDSAEPLEHAARSAPNRSSRMETFALSTSSSSTTNFSSSSNSNEPSTLVGRQAHVSRAATLPASITTTTPPKPADGTINLDELIDAIKRSSGQLETRLHLRDWIWTLPRVKPSRNGVRPPGSADNASALASKFAWHFEWARRNDVKVNADTYGFVLTGHEIDASYRVYNELYLVSANHLIAINYTKPSETVTSVHPVGDEFPGLSSTLLDPITGALYDRFANQIYFFKGDRYVGYDYATRRPLEDFLLPPAGSAVAPPASQPLVSSLPVVSILGRQSYVDGLYHDPHEDLVHIFTGMKFYTFQASDFKDGAFRAARQPAMRCINEHFLEGCRFDEAYPNPCRTSETDDTNGERDTIGKGDFGEGGARGSKPAPSPAGRRKFARLRLEPGNELGSTFDDEQQMKLRSIAARGGGLLDYLLESTLFGQGQAARSLGDGGALFAHPPGGSAKSDADDSPTSTAASQQPNAQERIVLYLLVAMVLITVMVTLVMIVVILNWARTGHRRLQNGGGADRQLDESELKAAQSGAGHEAQLTSGRLAYPPVISQYLNNQYHHQHGYGRYQQQQQHRRYQLHLAAHSAQLQAPPSPPPKFPRRSSQSSLPPPPPHSQMFAALWEANGSRAAPASSSRHTNGVDSNTIDSSAL